MKITPEKILPLSIAVTSVLILITGILVLNGTSEYKASLENYNLISKQVKEIETLKTRWSNEAAQNDLAYLNNHPNLIKNEKRGVSLYLEFNNLSANEFNHISNRLLNSMLIIKKLTLTRNSASKGVITVELES